MADLGRLFRPRSIAVIGGGAWCRNIIEQSKRMGFEGDIWPVHPEATAMAGLPCFGSIANLPDVPDACFIGVNRYATVDIVAELSALGAGGAVCFASGFQEAEAEDPDAADLGNRLIKAAGDMPILGPNCYGFINYLDGALLWPDQHGGVRVDSGVAIITQSSNIAISLTMQRRSLPIAYVATAGNQSQQSLSSIGANLLADDRVTALGLHIEGINDLRGFEGLATTARELSKPIIAIKVGKSEQARAATVSHTASLAGQDAGAQALLDRLGIARVNSLPAFLETLKLLHVAGPLADNSIASISCSGGEAALVADMAVDRNLQFAPLSDVQRSDLQAALGPLVAMANPLDYHTYIWNDVDAMTATFTAMAKGGMALTLVIVDFPRADRCDPTAWDATVAATITAAQYAKGAVAMVATLPENMPEVVAQELIAGGVVPMMGLDEALTATEAASIGTLDSKPAPAPLLLPHNPNTGQSTVTLDENSAKQRLQAHGLRIPQSRQANSPQEAAQVAQDIGFPVVLKGAGFAHKTEAGAVRINLCRARDVADAATKMPTSDFLVEEMITGTLAELLVGVVHDPAHGFVLTLGAGGVLTEILEDSTSILIPSSPAQISQALTKLKVNRLLCGFRGSAAVDIAAIVNAVLAIQDFVLANAATLEEVEINPLLCSATDAVAADALIRLTKETP